MKKISFARWLLTSLVVSHFVVGLPSAEARSGNSFPVCPFAATLPENPATVEIARLEGRSFRTDPRCELWRKPGFDRLINLANSLQDAINSEPIMRKAQDVAAACERRIPGADGATVSQAMRDELDDAVGKRDLAGIRKIERKMDTVFRAIHRCDRKLLELDRVLKKKLLEDLARVSR
jgi:hypothetical protein